MLGSPLIPESELEDGRIYKIRSRNLLVGLWRAKTRGFIGVREKFNEKYLFEEYAWETGPPYGTARAVEALDLTHPVPEDYWNDDLGLFQVLLPLDERFVQERREENRVMAQEAESRRWAPKTEAEVLREERVAKVREWAQEARAALKAEIPEGMENPEFVERNRAIFREYTSRLQQATSPDKEQ